MSATNNGESHAPSERHLITSERSWLAYKRKQLGRPDLTFEEADAIQQVELDEAFRLADEADVIIYADTTPEQIQEVKRRAEAGAQSKAFWLDYRRKKHGDPTLTYEQADDIAFTEQQVMWKLASEAGVVVFLGAEQQQNQPLVVEADQPVRLLPEAE